MRKGLNLTDVVIRIHDHLGLDDDISKLNRITDLLVVILEKQHKILHHQEKQMAQIDDLNTKLATLQNDVNTLDADVKAVVLSPSTDLTTPIAAVDSLTTQVQAIDAAVKAL
jgi:hypothetical protein